MTLKPALTLSPLLLCLLAGAARADLAPYSFGASETIQHQSNIAHAADTDRQADWLSTTEFRAALDQALGRDELKAHGAVDLTRYKNIGARNSTGYTAGTEFDWSVPGDLSGVLGAESRRRQYLYGLDSDTGQPTTARNMETDDHVYAHAQLGGVGRWTIFSGFDGTRRRYSDPAFRGSDERQWSANAGTRYATSPDLNFGLTFSYTHGEYPHLQQTIGVPVSQSFSLRSVGLSTSYHPGGSTTLDATIGYTDQSTDIQSDRHFMNGSLDWTWTPPGHFQFAFGLARTSDADTSANGSTAFNPDGINGRSVNNVAHGRVDYSLRAKVSLELLGQYTQRRYTDALLPFVLGASGPLYANGANRTSQFVFSAHYQPTRNSDVSCGAGREVRHSDASIATLTPGYSDNTVQCTGSIDFK